ncbi:unnamed protein product [marine sediment metagenome]|uniref:Uncharacterized protein n=1 Tax=marine sediment metagenome TaxID=412755 RepID=X1JCB6_9ZZZZ
MANEELKERLWLEEQITKEKMHQVDFAIQALQTQVVMLESMVVMAELRRMAQSEMGRTISIN